MKIKSATISIDNIFNSLNLSFLEADTSTIHYFVGNNGSGKTHLLEVLHAAIANIHLGRAANANLELLVDPEEVRIPPILGNICSLQQKWANQSSMQAGKITGVEITEQEEATLRKAVYSDVEINFQHKEIKSTSAITVDNNTPKDKALDLNTVIPQLLVNLRQQDSNLRSDWMRDNTGNQDVPEKLEGEKLERFTSAYNRIFQDGKQYKEIIEENGNYNIIFTDANNNDVEIKDLSSGEKQIIYRLGFILKDLESIDGGFIFIDEPEISLHPVWQLRFKQLLLEIFQDSKVQIFIATHSPYIFGEMNPAIEECIKINNLENTAEKISFPSSRTFNAPSMNLVNFLAYEIPSKELHIELYNEMQLKSGKSYISDIDDWLESQGLEKNNRSISQGEKFIKNDGTETGWNSNETIVTWIRNKMHHADLSDRKEFSNEDLKESIKRMLTLL
jgi:predicted ATPase